MKRATIIIEASIGFLIAFENTIRMSADSLIASAHRLIVVKLYYIIRSVRLYYKECELLWVGTLSYAFFVGKRILSLLYNERIILTHLGDESKRNKISPTIIKRQENIWTIIENAVS